MAKQQKLVFVFLLFFLLFLIPKDAISKIRSLSLSESLEQAELVVYGRVEKIERNFASEGWGSKPEIAYASFKIEKAIRGKPEAKAITIIFLDGKTWIEDEPRYTAGERRLLFLKEVKGGKFRFHSNDYSLKSGVHYREIIGAGGLFFRKDEPADEKKIAEYISAIDKVEKIIKIKDEKEQLKALIISLEDPNQYVRKSAMQDIRFREKYQKDPREYLFQEEGKALTLRDAEGPLITGVDLVPLMISITPDYELVPESPLHRVYLDRVSYTFSKIKRKGENESQEEARLEKLRSISVTIAVFEDQERAALSLKQLIRRIEAGPGANIKGLVGDDSFLYVSEASLPMKNTHIRFRRRNVVIQLGLPFELARSLEVVQKIDNELVGGTQFVTRGEKVEVPDFTLIGLPETVKPGEKVLCNLELTNKNIDPAGILAGSGDWDPRGMVVRLGVHPEVTYYVPKIISETGVDSFSISVATSRNVLVTKTFMLKVIDKAE